MLGLASNRSSVSVRSLAVLCVLIMFCSIVYYLGDIKLHARYALYRYQKVSHSMVEHNPSFRIEELELTLEAQKLLYEAKIHSLESAVKNLEQAHAVLSIENGKEHVALARRFYSSSLARQHQFMIEQVSKPSLQLGHGIFLNDTLVGQVVHTSNKVSIVNMLSHASSQVPVTDANGAHHAIAKGTGDNNFLELVMMEGDASTLHEGDEWLTVGGGDYFPTGMKVGKLLQKNQQWYLTYSAQAPQGPWVLYSTEKSKGDLTQSS